MSPVEEESVTLIDNRNLDEPENRVLLLCEYASNDIKGAAIDRTEEHYLQGSDAYDPGAADLSNFVSESLQVMAVHGNFSRLIIDLGKHITSD